MARRGMTDFTARGTWRRLAAAALPLAASLALGACERNDMHNQPRHEPHEPSAFFADGQSSRPLVAGTVARGQLVSDDMRYAGLPEGPPVAGFPFEITRADLLRGQQRYNIYCSVCHGVDGDGNGMIVQRGFTRPPSLHEQRLQDAPEGHFFNVITNGWGAMYAYSDRINPEDRWRVIAYLRVLQLSQREAVASAAGAAAAPAQGGAAGASSPVQGAVDRVIEGSQDAQQQQQSNQDQPQQPPSGAQPQSGGQQ
jgi:mono/diheme cytochrome c family protein